MDWLQILQATVTTVGVPVLGWLFHKSQKAARAVEISIRALDYLANLLRSGRTQTEAIVQTTQYLQKQGVKSAVAVRAAQGALARLAS